MSPDWRPISEVDEASREALTLFVESGRVETKATAGVQYHYDMAGEHEAIGRIITRIRRNAGQLLRNADCPLFFRYAISYSGDPTSKVLIDSVAGIVGTEFVSNQSFMAECLKLQNEELHSVDILRAEIGGQDLIGEQWVHPLRPSVDWTTSSAVVRAGSYNHQLLRVGYDVFGIEFDYAAAKDLGCRLGSSGHVFEHPPPSGEPKTSTAAKWSAEAMTEAINEYCKRTQSGNLDKAWNDEFKALKATTGWSNTDFQNHWSTARGTKGASGRQSSASYKAARQSA